MQTTTNPYESPESPSDVVPTRIAPSLIRAVQFTAKVAGLGSALGAGIGILLCFVLSGGNATGSFYVTYGLFCAIVGLIGGLPAAAVVGMVRVLRRPTRHGRSAESSSA